MTTPLELAEEAEAVWQDLSHDKTTREIIAAPYVPQLAAALKQACELLASVTTTDEGLQEDDYGDTSCPWCHGERRDTKANPWPTYEFVHDADCPILAARAFLASDMEAQ
jgi:hypothetical protein